MRRKKAAILVAGMFLFVLFSKPIALFSISLYQKYISPHKGWCCAYAALYGEPSCSKYGKTVISRYGLFKGMFLLVQRLWACQEAAAILQRQYVQNSSLLSPKVQQADGCEECGEMCGPSCAACCAAGCLGLSEAMKQHPKGASSRKSSPPPLPTQEEPTEPPPSPTDLSSDSSSSEKEITDLHAILEEIHPTGAGHATAKQEKLEEVSSGIRISEIIAQRDYRKVMKYKKEFEEAGRKYNIPPAVLAAIASRETHGGAVGLDSQGWSQERSYGMMQIHHRNHPITHEGPFGQAHIDQAAAILKSNWEKMKQKYPHLSESQTLQLAVAAYNCGPNRQFDISQPDLYTTGKDYSNDVLARAKYFAKHWNP